MGKLRSDVLLYRWKSLDWNFKIILVESLILGVYFSYEPFISVFLARLGATTFQISLLTSLPAVSGLLLSIPIGGFLQSRSKIVPWYSGPRVLMAVAVALTGLLPFLFQGDQVILPILVVWGLATIPGNILMITFTVVMNLVAGNEGRYQLMSSRWGIICTASAITLAGVGWFLDRTSFPSNYQILFIGMALFGFAGAYTSHQLCLRNPPVTKTSERVSAKGRFQGLFKEIISERPFLSFMSKRFLFAMGMMLTYPLFPLYFVREIHASDGWIGIINTAQMAVIVVGYFFWMRVSRTRKDPYFILLITAFATALYPALVAVTHQVQLIVLYAGAIAFFQAGADLSFFDEQLRTIPPQNTVTFIAVAQSIQNLASIAGPMLGSFLADQFSLSTALMVGAGLKLAAFVFFFLDRKRRSHLEPVSVQ